MRNELHGPPFRALMFILLITTDIEVVSDMDIDEDKDMENASRCSSPLSTVPSEGGDVEFDDADMPPGEMAEKHVDDSPKAREVDMPAPKGKKTASQRTPKGKGKKKGLPEPVANGGEEAETSEGLQPPVMSPALEPSAALLPVPPVDINQQTEFSPRTVGTRLTRSARKRESSVVPKSEAVDADVVPAVEDRPSRRTTRKAPQSERSGAAPTRSAVASPRQLVDNLPASLQQAGGAEGDKTSKAPKSKRSGTGKGFAEILEWRDADGTWRPVDADAANTVPPSALEENLYFTQSGRPVRPHPSATLGHKEITTTSTRRTQSTHRTNPTSQKVASPASRQPTNNKSKPSQSDENRTKPSRTSRKADPQRDGSEPAAAQSGPPAAQTGISVAGNETTLEAPLSKQAVMSENAQRAQLRTSATPLMSQAEASRQVEPFTSASTVIQHAVEPAPKSLPQGSSVTKGKRPARNLPVLERPEQPLRNGSNGTATINDSRVISVATQPSDKRRDESVTSELQALREGQNAFATNILELEEQQTAAAEALARSRALLDRMKQDALAQKERMDKFEERYSTPAAAPAVPAPAIPAPLPAKGARRNPGVAVPKTKEAVPRQQGQKKRKADSHLIDDVQYPCMLISTFFSLHSRTKAESEPPPRSFQ